MKVRRMFCFLFLALGFASISMRGYPAAEAEQKAMEKSTFLVIYRPGPAWPEGKKIADLPLKEHFQYLIGLFANNSMKFAGPLMDDSGGAVVLEVESEAEAKAIVAEDPAVKSGIFSYQIHPWRLVPWHRYVPD